MERERERKRGRGLLLDALLPAGMELGADALAVEVNAASTLCLVGHPIALDLAAPAHQACGLLRTRRLLRHGGLSTGSWASRRGALTFDLI